MLAYCRSKARLTTLIHVLVSCDQCALNCNRTWSLMSQLQCSSHLKNDIRVWRNGLVNKVLDAQAWRHQLGTPEPMEKHSQTEWCVLVPQHKRAGDRQIFGACWPVSLHSWQAPGFVRNRVSKSNLNSVEKDTGLWSLASVCMHICMSTCVHTHTWAYLLHLLHRHVCMNTPEITNDTA